jgi:hypothetical protein
MNGPKIGTRHPWLDPLGSNLSDFVSESNRRHQVGRRRLGLTSQGQLIYMLQGFAVVKRLSATSFQSLENLDFE